MIALLVVALGAVVAAVGTGVLVARSTNKPRIYSVAWAVALFGLAIGLAAATLGYLAGFGAVLFRAMELGTQLIAPICLVLALIETTGKSLAARFAMRLSVAGLSVIALVIMGTDPVNPDATFSSAWPDPAKFYQLAPLTVLGVITLLTAATAAGTLGVLAFRSRRDGLPQAETRPVMFTALAALAISLPGLVWLADKGLSIKLPLPAEYLFALCNTLAAGLIWWAARLAGSRDLGQAGTASAPDRDDRDRRSGDWDDRAGYGSSDRSSYGGYETGDFDRYGSAHHDDYDSRPGSHAAASYVDDDRYGETRRAPQYDEPVSAAMYPGLAALAAEAAGPAGPAEAAVRFGEPAEFIHTGAIDSRGDYGDSDQYDADEGDRRPGGYDEDSGVFYADDTGYGFSRVEPEDGRVSGWDDRPNQRGGEPRGELFGQITIYTLIEGRTDEFDRLTEWVVAQVQSKEPDTLVYIVHAVPTAPMQRILYEVYRDRDAHEQHLNRQYVITYEVEQKPFVLATNVIELGLQQAKVSPLPSISAISDILSESGIDLTGVARPAPRPPERVPPVRPAQPGTAMTTRPYQRPPARPAPPAPPARPAPPAPPAGPAADPRYSDPRYAEPQYPDQRYPDQRHPVQQYPDQRYPDQRHPDQQYPDQRYPDQRHPARQYPDQRYPDQRHPDQQYPDQQYEDPQYEGPHQGGGWAEIRGEDSRY